MSIVDEAVRLSHEYLEKMPKAKRKTFGQFFTSKETAVFMAGLFDIDPSSKTLSLLDPGAGSGILSVALLQRLEQHTAIKEVQLTCYETDSNVIELLEQNLRYAREHVSFKLHYRIIKRNYILSQSDAYNASTCSLFGQLEPMGLPLLDDVADDFVEAADARSGVAQDGTVASVDEADADTVAAAVAVAEAEGLVEWSCSYDVVIGNPPYLKLAKSAPEAMAMADVCYGAPNLYFLFAMMSLFNLKVGGQLVYIIPRSWTSGAYFRKFREKFLSMGVLEHIHLFVSRDKVFEKDSVLQETMIVKVRRGSYEPDSVLLSSTQSNGDFEQLEQFSAPYSTVVSGVDRYVYLVTSHEEVATLNALHQWTDTLPSLGLKMRTGITVDFRNLDILREEDSGVDANGVCCVPVFDAQHLKDGRVVFPLGGCLEYILTERSGVLQPNHNYLLVKRFTTKEEKRRLQCALYLSKDYAQYPYISTQNKLNFITGSKPLSEAVVYGLYVLFNSTLYDNYYRILNGSTQVNSTELNSMSVPPLEAIELMGKRLLETADLSVESCDRILEAYIHQGQQEP